MTNFCQGPLHWHTLLHQRIGSIQMIEKAEFFHVGLKSVWTRPQSLVRGAPLLPVTMLVQYSQLSLRIWCKGLFVLELNTSSFCLQYTGYSFQSIQKPPNAVLELPRVP